ncbi:NepR family anti-sigma factor [Agrobacterium sp. ES01]|uniref:NepR family anti-sigma factor n=1 Tax=Agrobacterium sp. ES01 TaxID=3420714 RepID=UPI003D0CA90B
MQQMDNRSSKGLGSDPGPYSDVIQDGVALKLKELYSSLEGEAVPDQLLQLLDKLEAAEKASLNSVTSKDAVDE